MSWVDSIKDKSRFSPETLKRWRAESVNAKKQHKDLMKNPHRNLPSTAPARMAYEERQQAKQKALSKLKNK